MARGEQLKAELVLLALTAFWGATFVVVRDALDAADPVTLLALRFSIAALAGLALGRRAIFQRTMLVPGLVMGGLLFVGYQAQTWGQLYISPARSAFLTGLMVVLVPFVSPWVVGRWPGPFAFLGVTLAGVGLWVMTGSSLGTFGKGELLTLGGAVAYAFHIAFTERFSPGRAPFGLLGAQLLPMAFACLAAFPLGPQRVSFTPALVAAVLGLGVLGSALAIGIQMWAQARTSAVRAALLYATEPVFAAALSLALRREVFTTALAAGGALIITGVLVGELGGAWWARRREAARTA